MSLSPADHPHPSSGDPSLAVPHDSSAPPEPRPNRLWTLCFILLALEVGLFLAVFPWVDAWHLNHFRAFFPSASALWDDPYLKGAVTGLGVTNLFVALGQSVHLVRSLRKPKF